jgi:hypothetical protein
MTWGTNTGRPLVGSPREDAILASAAFHSPSWSSPCLASQLPKQERIVNQATLPIFVSFFTWGLGTGAQNLGRPLFAFAATGNMFLVGILIASNAIPRMFTGPLTGYLTDRLGRKPLAFPDSASVNKALRSVLQGKRPRRLTTRSTRTRAKAARAG